MSDNELLLSISNLMDIKLEPIKKDISELKNDITNLEQNFSKLELKISNLEDNLSNVEYKISNMDNRLTKLEINMENIMIPRLEHIEECYISTYDRYKSHADNYEILNEDVKIIKKVITEHSGKLKMIY